jgi:hypothetical protein
VAATALAAQQKLTGDLIPQISANAGVLAMTFHQINADGAGPIACSISTDAMGKTFTATTVSKTSLSSQTFLLGQLVLGQWERLRMCAPSNVPTRYD